MGVIPAIGVMRVGRRPRVALTAHHTRVEHLQGQMPVGGGPWIKAMLLTCAARSLPIPGLILLYPLVRDLCCSFTGRICTAWPEGMSAATEGQAFKVASQSSRTWDKARARARLGLGLGLG